MKWCDGADFAHMVHITFSHQFCRGLTVGDQAWESVVNFEDKYLF